MTREQIYTYVAAILTTLAETTDAAESTLYLALGADIHRWEQLRGLMVASDLISVDRSNRVSLTHKGRQTAQQCNAVLSGG